MSDSLVTFANVSRFYGEVLGINKVSLAIPPGITSLVGPNGSGKTTLMNLMTGLIRPTQGEIRVLGITPDHPEKLCRVAGYCTQFDAFPKGLTGYQFIYWFLRIHGMSPAECEERTSAALEKVSMTPAAQRPVAAYSKGMRQRIKLAQAIAHDPRVLVLDEPLNGLDPMARAETIALFRQWGDEGRHVVVSSLEKYRLKSTMPWPSAHHPGLQAPWAFRTHRKSFTAVPRMYGSSRRALWIQPPSPPSTVACPMS